MIDLKPFGEHDFKRLMSWITDEAMLMQFAGPLFSYPLNFRQLDQYLEDYQRWAFKVMLLPEKIAIGHAEIYWPDLERAVLCRLLIGDAALRGKGHGQEMIHRLLSTCFKQPRALMAELNVFEQNTAAIHCYRKAGFRESGKKLVRNFQNSNWTAINMIVTREDWENKKI